MNSVACDKNNGWKLKSSKISQFIRLCRCDQVNKEKSLVGIWRLRADLGGGLSTGYN